MEAKAKVKYLRIGPRKARLVLDLIRNKSAQDALDILTNLNKKAARMAEQLLKTAIANAKVLKMDESSLYIADLRADGGPVMKRFMSRSMGRADKILKRTTHFSIVLVEKKNNEETVAVEKSLSKKSSVKKSVKKVAAKTTAKKAVKKAVKKTATKASK
jgi:large subunit ribosomal protein L22